eukprot:7749475-Ditylum_brightwellii.AAC.1
MTIKQDINYKNNCLEYPGLSKIHGKPTTSALFILCNEVQSNAQSIDMTLGGGTNGHLGLVCDAPTYSSIPGTIQYLHPTNPGSLVIPGNPMQFQIAHAHDLHEEHLHLFQKVNNIEHTLIQQIVKAFDEKYLTVICNPVTHKITRTIPQIFDYLFDAYGDVSPSQLQELCNMLENFNFNPYEPVDILYTEINSFANLAKIGHSPIMNRQKNRLCLFGTAKNWQTAFQSNSME